MRKIFILALAALVAAPLAAAKKKKKAQPAPTNRSSHSATYMKKHKDD